jgi:hypothetical protein
LIFEFHESDKFIAWWLGDQDLKIHDFGSYPWKSSDKSPGLQMELLRRFGTKTFHSLNGKELIFATDARPFKRCLAYQVRLLLAFVRSLLNFPLIATGPEGYSTSLSTWIYQRIMVDWQEI